MQLDRDNENAKPQAAVYSHRLRFGAREGRYLAAASCGFHQGLKIDIFFKIFVFSELSLVRASLRFSLLIFLRRL
jgi:hypothetical protein